MRKSEYCSRFVPDVIRFKFKYWGHDAVVLHNHDIRKAEGEFAFLTKRKVREEFMRDLARLVEQSPFTGIAICIRKDKLKRRCRQPENPYNLAMKFGLERVNKFLEKQGEAGRSTHVVFEKRGAREDSDLELEFRRICDRGDGQTPRLPFHFAMAHKRTNSSGLQLADLIA